MMIAGFFPAIWNLLGLVHHDVEALKQERDQAHLAPAVLSPTLRQSCAVDPVLAAQVAQVEASETGWLGGDIAALKGAIHRIMGQINVPC